ncbi:MAG: TetR/AcrR family transcriptional regulator [Mycobacteriales bacterium]
MGRIAGVTAAETRGRLIAAAARAFAQQGYEGTRVADIAAAAGVSNGALYAHFGGKAQLLVEALNAGAPGELTELFLAHPEHTLPDLLTLLGAGLPTRPTGSLVVEALVAARRDQDVRTLMRSHLGSRNDWFVDLVRTAQAHGQIDPALDPEALAQFCLVVVLGSALVAPARRDSDDEAWTTLVTRLVDALRPTGRTERRRS